MERVETRGSFEARQTKGFRSRGLGKVAFVGSVLAAFAVGFVVGAIFEHRSLEGGKRGSPSSRVSGIASGGEESRGLTGEERSALALLEEKVVRDPGDANGWIELGNLNYDLGRPAEAIRAYEKALALQPQNPDVLTDMGTMYRALGYPEKAVELYRQAHRLDPNHFNSLYNEGVVLLHDLNDIDGAARAWRQFLALVPQGPQSERIRRILETLKEQGKIN